MPTVVLQRHPRSPCAAVHGIETLVDLESDGRLRLTYTVTGALEALRIPPPGASERADGLWNHTCLEAFIAVPERAGYWECNFAPSTQWAIYRFDGYRTGMAPLADSQPVAITQHRDAGGLALSVVLSLHELPLLGEATRLRLALATVIEERSGRLSYWALAHPPGKPDFHHPASFVLTLARSHGA
jgi:hypothetical protein